LNRFTDVTVGRGDNVLVWTVTNGICENSSEVLISNYGVSATVSDEEVNICRDRYRLNGNNPNFQSIETPDIPATGFWETDGPGNFDDEFHHRTWVRNLRLDLNTVTWTIQNEYCSESVDVRIFNNTPSDAHAGPNETFCGIDFIGDDYSYSSTYTLNAEDPSRGDGHWTITAGGATFIDPTTAHNAQVTDLAHYAQLTGPDHWNMHPTVNTFRWTVEYKNCSVSDEVTITNAAPFEAQAGPDQNVCWDEANLNAICLGSGAQEHWWDEVAPGNSGAIINDINEFNSHVEDLQTGTTTFRWYKRNRINGVTCTIYDDTEVTRIGTTGTTTAGPNKAVCKTSAFLEATPPKTAFPSSSDLEGEWSVLQGNGDFDNINSHSTEVTNLGYQTNIFRWTITNNDMLGCIATADVEILNGLPSTPDGGENQVVCKDNTVLRAVRPTRGEGEWVVGTGGGSISATSCEGHLCTAIVTNLQLGPDNTVNWTVTNYYTDPGDGTDGECSLFDVVTIQNRSVTADPGTDRDVCGTEALLATDKLNAVPPGFGETGKWEKITGFGNIVDDEAFDTEVNGMQRGLNILSWTISNTHDCSDTKELIVNVGIPTTANVDPDNITVCAGPDDAVELKANTATHGTGSWAFANGIGNPVITNSAENITNVLNTPYNESIFRWSIVLKDHPLQCTSTDDLTITNNYIKAKAGDDDDICQDWYILQANDPTENDKPDSEVGSGKWTLSTGATGIFDNSTDENTRINGLSSTNPNTLRWTVTKGTCTDWDEVVITNHKFEISAGDPETVCENWAQLNGDLPGLGEGIWTSDDDPKPSFDDETDPDTYVRGLNAGLNTLKWTVRSKLLESCISEAEVVITYNKINVEAGNTQHICETTTNLAAIEPSEGLASWEQTQGTPVIIVNSTAADTEIQGMTGGTYKFKWTVVKDDCSNSDEVIIYNNIPQIPIANPGAREVCDNNGVLMGTEPLDGEWGLWSKVDADGNIANTSAFNTTVTGLKTGENIFKWTLYKGTINICELEAHTSIFNYTVEAGDEGDIETFCDRGNGWLFTDPPQNGIGYWTRISGTGIIDNSALNSTGVTNLSGGENKFKWTVKNAFCEDSKEEIIINNFYPTNAYPAESYQICENFALVIAEEPIDGLIGKWSMGTNGNGIFDDENDNITTVRELNQGINDIIWTVTKDDCENTAEFTLTNNFFTPIAGPNQEVPDPFTNLNAQESGIWTVAGGFGRFANSTDNKTYVDQLLVGVNTFRWTVSKNGCTNYKDVEVIYNALEAFAGDKQIICTDSTSMNANDPNIGTGTWSIVQGSGEFKNKHKHDTKVSEIDPGLNIYRWTVEKNGFSVHSDVEILNDAFYISAGVDGQTCNGEAEIQASNPYPGTGEWTIFHGGGEFNDSEAFKTEIIKLAPGQNLLIWEVTQTNCTLTDTVEVIYDLPPTAAFKMDKTAGCSPLEVTFTNTTTGGSIYYWNFGDDFLTETDLNSFARIYEAQYDADSTYSIQLIAESDKGCTDTLVQQVTAYSIPKVAFSASPGTQLYPRSTVNIENLSGAGYVDYHWDMGDGNTYLHNTMLENFSHSFSTWGEYEMTLSVFSNNCSDTAKQKITILAPQPTSTIMPGIRAQGCEDLSHSFEAYVNYAETYSWDFGDGGSSAEENPTYIFETPGTYIVTLNASGPGTDGELIEVRKDTVKVFVVPVADFELVRDTVMLPDPIICKNYSINADKYEWNFSGGIDSISHEKIPVHYYTKEGTYTISLEIWTEHNCFDSKTVKDAVVVEKAGAFVFPTAISIFSDVEENRIFKPKHRGIKEYELGIYNRWGEKIFETNNPDIGWNGYIDGKPGAMDVYVWKLTGKYKNGAKFKATGDVTLAY